MLSFMKKLYNDESGATAIEYGLIAALIAVVLVGVLATLGGNLEDAFTTISDAVEDPDSAAGGGGT